MSDSNTSELPNWYAGKCVDCDVEMVKRYFYLSDMAGRRHIGYKGRCASCTGKYAKVLDRERHKNLGAQEFVKNLIKEIEEKGKKSISLSRLTKIEESLKERAEELY